MKITDFPPYKPIEIFDSFVPQKLCLDIVKALCAEYKNTSMFIKAQGFDEPEARDIEAHVLRAFNESAFAGIPKKYRGQHISGGIGKNIRENFHRIIGCGPVLITQSKVEERWQLPRHAIFRRTYAESNQLNLFQENDDKALHDNENNILYAIVVHRPSINHAMPEFIDIVFPDRKYKTILGRIQLFERYANVVNEIAEQSLVALKPKRESI